MLDGITVDYYGTPTPIVQVASPRFRALAHRRRAVGQELVSVIEKAIRNSISTNPATDGGRPNPIPQLTEERRKELVSVPHLAEEARTAIRRPPRRQRQAEEDAQSHDLRG